MLARVLRDAPAIILPVRKLQGPRKSLVGLRSGRLQIISLHGRNNGGTCTWLCECDCGNQTIVATNHLHGETQSCGCLQKERTHQARFLHGEGKSPEYAVWSSMKDRCYNPSNRSFPDYGSRGITVCDRWKRSFVNFLEDMRECPPGLTLERIDNNKGYSKTNCRWATRAEQAVNKRNNRWILFRGELLCVSGWAKRLGIDHRAIHSRLRNNWSIEQALTTPVKTRSLALPRSRVAI